MPRPGKDWQKKYGKRAEEKKTLLGGNDTVLSAAEKLSAGDETGEAFAIILQSCKRATHPHLFVLYMDSMQMHGSRIVAAYHNWAKNDYDKLVKGVMENDESLRKFI